MKTIIRTRPLLAYAPLALAVAIGIGSQAHAATIVVNSTAATEDSSTCTLVDAVAAVNNPGTAVGTCTQADGDNDTIDLSQLPLPATISFTVPTNSHALEVDKAVSIVGSPGDGTPQVTIERSSASGTATFGLLRATAPMTLTGLTFTNGNSGDFLGGAILSSSALTLNNCVVSNNHSNSAGGGISATGNLTMTDSVVSGNTAGNAGGGIYSSNNGAVSNSAITGNSTQTATAAGGGGVYSSGGIRFDNTLITGNTSASSGGGVVGTTTLGFAESTLSGNTAAKGSGGAVFMLTGIAMIVTSTFSKNTASANGGAISAQETDLTNSTVTGNTATAGNGGGISADTFTATYSTIALNTSANSGGGATFSSGADVQGTILFGNMPDDFATSTAGTLASGDYNIIGSTTVTGETTVTCSDPQLQTLQDNGGPTQTMALGPTSCAIDQASSSPAEHTDQRGFSRPAVGGTSPKADIGAYEVGATDPDVIFTNGFES